MTDTSSAQNACASNIDRTTRIVAAYVANNSVPLNGIAGLIADVHKAVVSAESGTAPAGTPTSITKTPAEIRASVKPDALISFEDGRSYKTLRRHLTMRGLSPEQYRTKHGLPPDYPLVSANYSKQRSELARSLGLGQQRRKDHAPKVD
jgi:predicted transcriptional regulator